MRDWIFSSVASATARSSSPAAPPLQHRGDPCHAVCQESRACGDPGWPGRDRPGEVDQRTDPAPHPGDRGGDQGRPQGHQGDRRSSGTPPGLEQGRPEEERPPGLLHPTAGTGADHERDDREAVCEVVYLNHTGRPLAAKAPYRAAPEPEMEAPGPSTPALGTNTKMKKGTACATLSPTSMRLTPSAAGSPMNMGPTTPTSELFRSPWNGPVPGSVGARSASAGPSWAVPTPPEHRPVPGTPDEAASDPDSEELQSMDDNDAERIRALEEELQELRRKRNQKSTRGRYA